MATSCDRRQVFLGWDEPALSRAVDWLESNFAKARQWDLQQLLIAVPATRAGRRLLEMLAQKAAQSDAAAALTPPQICTVGELPDWLCPASSDHRIADDTHALLTRMHVLREETDSDRLARLLPSPPAEDDITAWWRLAQRIGQLGDDLATVGLSFAEVIEHWRAGKTVLAGSADSPERWEALAAIDQAYHESLDREGLIDRQRHRLQCVREGRCACDRPIILLAAPDLSRLLREMLGQLDTPVTALIHAPQTHAQGFDAFGALVPEYWRDMPVEFHEHSLRIVERVTDQPAEVAAAIAAINEQRHAAGRRSLAPDQISVGLADQTQGGAVRRALQRAGTTARLAPGQEVAQSPPARLLVTLAAFAERRRLDAFAELLRHPDVALYLGHNLSGTDATSDWLTLLDDYISRSLRQELAAEVLGEGDRYAALVRVYHAISSLLPEDPWARHPLCQWAQTIAATLGAFYSQRQLSHFDREDVISITALGAIGEVLRRHAQLDGSSDTTPRVTLSEAMRLVIVEAGDRPIPDPGGVAAIELMGFLELPLDDAPAIVITSLNEQHIPATPRGDAFLPDALRRSLGIADSTYRFARDKLLMLAATAAREHLVLIAPRRATEGDPLTPSRLLLACDQATRTRRIRRFYDNEMADCSPLRRLLAPGPYNRFLIPHPHRFTFAGASSRIEPKLPDDETTSGDGSGIAVPAKIDKLDVTAFRDYLDCPYRFYLKHVCRLKPRDDRATELDAPQFGDVAHEVLEAFARHGPTASDDCSQVADFLREALDESFRRTFGTRLRPALLIQRQQLQERLEAFARVQAGLAATGWRIAHAEQKLTAQLCVEGHAVALKGKIDRIDVHGEHGYRIIDYKTGDTAKKPQQTHRGRIRRKHRPAHEHDAEGWVDLQLPLYLDMVEQAHGISGESTTLAQFNLPRKLDDVALESADWDSSLLEEARRVRDWVVAQICAGNFWPPQEPSGWEDAFTWICADTTLDRDKLIRDSEAVLDELRRRQEKGGGEYG